MKDKKIVSTKFMEFIINELCKAPSGQISEEVRNNLIKFKSEEHTLTEKYDFIVSISKLPRTEISKFIVSMCELDKYYLISTE